MPAPRLLPRGVKQAWDTFFRKDVQLQLDGLHPHLHLAEPAPPAAVPREAAAARRSASELELMRGELAALLDEQPGSRRILRHLALLERALARDGLAALTLAPLPLLAGALGQFEALVTNWSRPGLAALRSKVAVALIERDAEGAAQRVVAPSTLPETLPLHLENESAVPGLDVRSDDEVAAVYRAMGLAAPTAA